MPDISKATPRPKAWVGTRAPEIVRAVNSHDALVVALRKARVYVALEWEDVGDPIDKAQLDVIDAALAAAEEPQP